MSTVLTETLHANAFLVSEANGFRSREEIVVAQSQDLLPGTILGRRTIGAVTSAAKSGGNTGNGTLTLDATTPALANAMPGVYTVRFTSATAYTVEDPTGRVIGSGVNGTAFSDGIKFTTAAGGTAFIAGDGFDVTVAAGSGQYAVLAPTAVDGSQVAAAIIIWPIKTALGETRRAAAFVRDMEARASDLTWPAGITAGQKNAAVAQLMERGIILR